VLHNALLELRRIGGTLLGWLLWIAIILVWGLLLVPLTLLLSPLWPAVRELFSTATRLAMRAFVWTMPFARFELDRVERRLEGPRILVVNHVSRLDSPVLLGFEPRLAGPVRGYMLRVPLIGSIIRTLGFFDADAGDFEAVEGMHRAAVAARERGGGLLFYPEGTRSRTGEIGAFHRGAFRLAVDHDLPIQPVVLEGLDVVFPPGHVISPVRGRHLVQIHYLEPLHPPYGAGPRRDVVRRLSERVRGSLVEALARLRAERSDQAPTLARHDSG